MVAAVVVVVVVEVVAALACDDATLPEESRRRERTKSVFLLMWTLLILRFSRSAEHIERWLSLLFGHLGRSHHSCSSSVSGGALPAVPAAATMATTKEIETRAQPRPSPSRMAGPDAASPTTWALVPKLVTFAVNVPSGTIPTAKLPSPLVVPAISTQLPLARVIETCAPETGGARGGRPPSREAHVDFRFEGYVEAAPPSSGTLAGASWPHARALPCDVDHTERGPRWVCSRRLPLDVHGRVPGIELDETGLHGEVPPRPSKNWKDT